MNAYHTKFIKQLSLEKLYELGVSYFNPPDSEALEIFKAIVDEIEMRTELDKIETQSRLKSERAKK